MIRASVFGLNVILETDDPTVKALLEFTTTENKYNFFLKRVAETKTHGKIYNRRKTDQKTGHIYFEIGIGWTAYLINLFGQYMYEDDVNQLKAAVCQDNPRTFPFTELRPYQNDDVLHLLKYRFGLVSVYTGYGKTAVISVLANYFKEIGLKVLLVTPNKKPQDELIKRIKKFYNYDVSSKLGDGQIQCVMTQGFTNRKDVKDPNLWLALEAELKTFDVVMADEVEYCINPSGILIFNTTTNAKYRFGFSGTADKARGEMINFNNGLENPAVSGNLDLIRFFGPSLVYRKPLQKEIDLITVSTSSLDRISLKDANDSGNLYLSIMTKIFTSDEVCKCIVNIAKTFPLLYIPINNLVNIINFWIDNYFLRKFRVLLVCNEGYIYYDIDGNKSKHTLEESCELIKNGQVDIIPSTSSGFRALDLPNLKNILIFAGKIGGSVLQQVGRVAREPHMNIISLAPSSGKTIPVFTKGAESRETLIKEYYKYCTITEVFVDESDLKNYKRIR